MNLEISLRIGRALTAVWLAGALVAASACGGSGTTPSGTPAPAEIVVFAAASLTEAFNEIGPAFGAANGGAKVIFNFAGSQQLAQQIGQGAPCDVFASANKKQMEAAVASGRIEPDTARSFVRNRLVVAVPKDNPGKVTDLKDLAKPGLKLVLAAKEVPVGQYSLEMLDKAGLAGDVTKNIVSYEQDVKAVLAKVSLGEADAGVVYASDVTSASKDKVSQIEVPDAVNVIADYPIAALKDSKHAELAKKFVEYVRSSSGQTVLVKYGFTSTSGTATGEAPGAAPVEVTGLVAKPQRLSADDLKKMEQTKVEVTGKDGATSSFTGVRIVTLLESAGLKPDAKTVALVGGDKYTKELSLEDLRKDDKAIVAIESNGSLRSVVPSQGPGYGVKGLVQIDVK